MNTFFLIVVTVVFASSLNVRDNIVIRGLSLLMLSGLIMGIIYSLPR